MSATPKFAHAVFQTAQPTQMTDWYCTVLDGHVVYQDNALCFITFDNEHHRVALIHPPVPRKRRAHHRRDAPRRCTTKTPTGTWSRCRPTGSPNPPAT